MLALAVVISFVLLGALPCNIDGGIVDDLAPSSPVRALAPFITFARFLYMLLDKLKSKFSPVMSDTLCLL